MKISVVIPNYNGLDLLKENLLTISNELHDHEIIIVDDGSKDGSVEFIKQNFSQVKIIAKPFNDGFATAVNLGVKAAFGDFVLLLNTDVVPNKGFLTHLLPHFQNLKVFAVGCMDKSMEGNEIIMRGRGVGKFVKGFLQHQRGDIDKKDTLWVNGGSGIFRKSIWEKLGGMNEIYNPFYWEDIDLSYRAKKSGYLTIFESKSVVEHNHMKGSIKQKYSQPQILQIAYRNQILFVWNNITSISYLIEHFLWLTRYLISALLKGNREFINGFISALKLIPRILKHRALNKNKFLITDEQIMIKF